MRKAFFIFLALIMVGGILLADVSAKIMKKVDVATCAITSYFEMTGEQLDQEREQRSGIGHPLITVPLGKAQGSPNYVVVYIGAGTLLKDNYILTVRHMIKDESGKSAIHVYAIFEGLDHPVECNVIAVSEGKEFYDDYAVLKLNEDVKRNGLKIAKNEFRHGEWVIFSGSTGGLAFWTRIGHAVDLRQYFFRDVNTGILHLGFLGKFYFLTVYPGGPGDSGGSIKNEHGEIIGLMYCGISLYDEQYILSNPLSILKVFLQNNGLWFLVE
jgi:hypothetical protein